MGRSPFGERPVLFVAHYPLGLRNPTHGCEGAICTMISDREGSWLTT